MKQKYSRLKKFLFNIFFYIIINTCFLKGMGIVSRYMGNGGGGDGDIGIAVAVLIIFIQLLLGIIFTVILAVISCTHKLAVSVYLVINSLILLFFLFFIYMEPCEKYGYYLSLITGAILVSFSFFYSFLLKKYFEEIFW